MTVELEKQKTPNEWADFWRNDVGVNVIPANATTKTTWVQWKKGKAGNWQEQPIPESFHASWKKANSFKDGMAVICGRCWHTAKETWLNSIDVDNKLGIDEFCKLYDCTLE
ncbi:MAG: hypothetical protein OER82_09435, partial [Nitrosopumilus sp.]|nr:hypothetical protein [Nitrosopumilus sp.]